MDRSDYIDENIQFGLNPNVDDLIDYLNRYHIISEKNGVFLTIYYFDENPKLKLLLKNLNDKNNDENEVELEYYPYNIDDKLVNNEKDNGRYSTISLYNEKNGSLKCIYDTRYFSNFHNNFLFKVGEIIQN